MSALSGYVRGNRSATLWNVPEGEYTITVQASARVDRRARPDIVFWFYNKKARKTELRVTWKPENQPKAGTSDWFNIATEKLVGGAYRVLVRDGEGNKLGMNASVMVNNVSLSDDPAGTGGGGDEKRDMPDVLSANLMKDTNSRNHHTDGYWNKTLVTRRGSPFTIALTLSSDVEVNPKLFRLIGRYKVKGRESFRTFTSGTDINISVGDDEANMGSYLKFVEQKGNQLIIEVKFSASSPIGKCELHTMLDDSEVNIGEVFVVFNPWSREDVVYMDDEAERNEYVLSEQGRVYVGSSGRPYGRPWNYGQFEEGILEAVLEALQNRMSPFKANSSAVFVSRVLSAVCNSNDNAGMLIGNWSGEYDEPEGSKSPSHWIGSPAIIRQFQETGKSVAYGQCWVFAGILTTCCRVLGIPCRPVTNFSSAHDTENSLTIDMHYDEDLEPMEELNTDSVWNFHVWCEAFMSRLDLPSGWGGWQAIDATPQETSDGYYLLGPAPINAVKKGEVYLSYDCRFVFSEVNADRVYWREKPDGGFDVFRVEKSSIGKNISTKAVGSQARVDLTDQYKYPEGSAEERIAVKNAAKYGSGKTKIVYEESHKKEDVTVDIDAPEIAYGQDITGIVTLRNVSGNDVTAEVYLRCYSESYTGIILHNLITINRTVMIKAGGDSQLRVKVDDQHYIDKLDEIGFYRISVSGLVVNTNQPFVASENYTFDDPNLHIEVPAGITFGKQSQVLMTFKNPLSMPLTNCRFVLEGTHVQRPKTVTIADIAPGQTGSYTELITPRMSGNLGLIVSFQSKQIPSASESVSFEVASR